jgi:hypothetical protein
MGYGKSRWTLQSDEPRATRLRITFVRFFAGVVQPAAIVLLASCLFGQNAPPTSPMPSAQATSISAPIDLKPDATGNVPLEQIRELLRRAEEKDLENDKRARDYTYVEREERHHLDSHGVIKKVESRTLEVLEVYGEQVERLTAKDGKPLSADEAKKEDDKIQKIIDRRKNESDKDRNKRLEREAKDRDEDRKFVLEIADAFNFRLLGSEIIEGQDTWIIEGDPRPDFKPKNRQAQILSKFKGRVWIDKKEEQWVKIDVTAIDTISVGFGLARFHKGTQAVVEMTKVNDELWLPKHVLFHVDLRLALLKSYNEDVEQTYSDYKKFRADTKITVVGEANH